MTRKPPEFSTSTNPNVYLMGKNKIIVLLIMDMDVVNRVCAVYDDGSIAMVHRVNSHYMVVSARRITSTMSGNERRPTLSSSDRSRDQIYLVLSAAVGPDNLSRQHTLTDAEVAHRPRTYQLVNNYSLSLNVLKYD